MNPRLKWFSLTAATAIVIIQGLVLAFISVFIFAGFSEQPADDQPTTIALVCLGLLGISVVAALMLCVLALLGRLRHRWAWIGAALPAACCVVVFILGAMFNNR